MPAGLTRYIAAPTLGSMWREPSWGQRNDDDRLRRKHLKLDLIYGALALVLFGFIAFGIIYHLY
jgi:hypothetical protein